MNEEAFVVDEEGDFPGVDESGKLHSVVGRLQSGWRHSFRQIAREPRAVQLVEGEPPWAAAPLPTFTIFLDPEHDNRHRAITASGMRRYCIYTHPSAAISIHSKGEMIAAPVCP